MNSFQFFSSSTMACPSAAAPTWRTAPSGRCTVKAPCWSFDSSARMTRAALAGGLPAAARALFFSKAEVGMVS